MPSLADLMTDDRRAKLAREMTHSGQYNNDAIRAQRWQDIANAPGQYAQGMFTDYAGRMVDIANMALMPFGLDREKPVLGSRHLAELIEADESALPYRVAQYMPLDVGDVAMSAKMFAPALVAALGGTAIAAKASKGATLSDLAQAMPKQRGIFAGVGAKTADRNALTLAEQMKAQGIADDVIHAKTGWFFGMPDGKPRFEIPDNAATVTPFDKLKSWGSAEDLKIGNSTTGAVGDFIEHPQLSNAYDGMMDFGNADKRITMRVVPGKQGASFNEGEMTGFGQTGQDITIGTEGNVIHKSNALHELQHAIQQREGWARGGSPEGMEDFMRQAEQARGAHQQSLPFRQWAAKQDRLIEELDGDALDAALKAHAKDYPDSGLPYIDPTVTPQEAYKRLAGEAEARLTQARMNLTPEQRLASYPPSMFDVPVDQQIVRYGDGTAMSTANIPKKLYRGIKTGYQSDGSEGYGTAMLGKGLYTSPSKKFASQYGDVIEISPEIAYPKNPLILPTGRGDARSTFMDWALKESGEKNAREFGKKYPDYSEFVRSRGFDGVVAGDEIVKYADTYDELLSTAQKSVDDMRDKYIGYK